MKCRKCDNRLITATFDGSLPFQPDSEPYESGVVEKADFDIDEQISIGVLWCETHGLQSAWVIEPKSNIACSGQEPA